MTLLAAAAQQSATTTTTTAAATTTTTTSGGPYNAASHLTTPTYDGSGNAVHPDVIDFGVAGWNGWRFWMAMTPYPNSNDDYENPSVLVSADGSTWQVPSGLTNPIYPAPTSGWNSDTDLVYDPVSDELVLIYRDNTFRPNVARSSDGTTWPASPTPVTWDAPTEECASPAIVRLEDGSWLMFGVSYPTRSVTMRWSAATLEGPWTRLPDGSGLGSDTWHLDVYRSGSRLHALVSDGRENESQLHKIRVATSDDLGVTWVANATPVIPKGTSGSWDSSLLYRGSLQPHENGTHYRVWYAGCKNRLGGPTDSWHIGLTVIPSSEWPTLP